jgi:[ribosomal protein S5]-alanine N-acetyltransferase
MSCTVQIQYSAAFPGNTVTFASLLSEKYLRGNSPTIEAVMEVHMHQPIHLDLSNGYYLSAVKPDDKDAYIEHFKDRRIYENTLAIPYPYTEADADWWIQERVLNPQTSQLPCSLFAIRNPQGFLIGSLDAGCKSASNITHSSEIGYWLAPPYWGKGIMTEGVVLLCDYAFKELALTKLTAHVFIFNRRSARVLEKNGFAIERVIKKYHYKDGAFIDACLYTLIR